MRTKFWAIIKDGEIMASMGAGLFFKKKEAEFYAQYIDDCEVKRVEVKIL